jgi:ComF family protein
MKKIVKSMKYRLALDVWRDFKNAIVPKTVEKLLFFKDRRDLLLQPIPLHPNRLRERGFNQAKEVAEFINKYTNIPFIDVLQRTKDTPAQAQLTRQKDRYDNIRNAFKLIDFQRIEDKNIVLIDDVITTGWTVKEAAMILKKNRALKVFVVTIARG